MPHHRVEASNRVQTSGFSDPNGRRGAFGLEVNGLPASALLTPLPTSLEWPAVQVMQRQHIPGRRQPADALGRDWGEVALSDGDRAVVDRVARSATLLTGSTADDGRLAHPFLAVVGSLFGWWLGRDVFHGGALSVGGRGWAVIGGYEAGKSSLLAELAAAGETVLTDDLVVIEEGAVLAGPRCLDLRPPALDIVNVSGPTRLVRAGERHRMLLDPAPPVVPLHGWVFLSWGSRLRARQLSPSERLAKLSAERSAGRGILELVRLPGWELERPQQRSSLAAAAEAVLELAAAEALGR